MLKLTFTSFIILLASATNATSFTLDSIDPKEQPIQTPEMTFTSAILFESLEAENVTNSLLLTQENSLTPFEKNAPKPAMEIHEASYIWGLLLIGVLVGIQLLFSYQIITTKPEDLIR